MVYSTLALLLAGKFLTNALPPEAVGQFALLLLCAECMGTIANLGLPATLPKLLQSREEPARSELFACLFTFQGAAAFAVAALCGAAVLLGEHWLPRIESWLPLPRSLAAILPVLLVAVSFRDFLLAGMAGLHEYGRRTAAILTISTLQAVFFAALYWGEPRGPLPFAISSLFAAAAGSTLLARRVPRPDSMAWGLAWAQVRFSLPLFVNNVLNFIYQRVDTLLVVHFLGLETGAVFEMSKRIPGVLSRFFSAALIPYLPSVAELLREGASRRAGALLHRASIYTAFSGYTMTLAMAAIAGPLLRLLFSEAYTGATTALGPLLAAACLAVQAGILGQALIALDRPRSIMYINLGLAAASLALNVALVPRFGLAGAGWSAVAATLFSYVLQWLAVRRAGLRIPAGRIMAVHGVFVLACGVSALLGGTPLALTAALLLFLGGCLTTGAVPLSTFRTLLRRAAR